MKHIFRLLCILMFLLHSTIIAQMAWEDVSIPTSDNLSSIRFFDAEEGYITISEINNEDSVYYTINGGATWNKQEFIPRPHKVWNCSKKILSPTQAWAYKPSTFYKTTNAGASWDSVEVDIPTNSEIISVINYNFLNMNEGVISVNCYDPDRYTQKIDIYKTINGGQSFYKTDISVNTENDNMFFRSICFAGFKRFGSNILWASIYEEDRYWVLDGQTIIISDDGGDTWRSYLYFPTERPRSNFILAKLYFLTENIRWYYDSWNSVLGETENGGHTWFRYGNRGALQNSRRPTPDIYWGLNSSGGVPKICNSLDKMESWQIAYTHPVQKYISDLYFFNDTTGWAIGYDGTIIKFIPPEEPVPEFHAEPLQGTAPLLVDFTNHSAGTFNTSSWSFGDGNMSSLNHPTNTYMDPGLYGVNLTIQNSFHTESKTKTGYILVYPSELPSHTETVFSEDFESTISELWEFKNPSQWDIQTGNNSLYIVDSNYSPGINDKLGEYALINIELDSSFSFEFKVKSLENFEMNWAADYCAIFGFVDEDNYYYVMFNALDMESCVYRVTSTERQLVQRRYGRWISDHTYHTIQIVRKENQIWVYFDSTVTFYCDNLEISGKVGFGSYNDVAMFDDVMMWVEDQNPEPPVADFDADTTFGMDALTVQFFDNSTGDITDWLWNFGDGNTSSEQHPFNTYQNPGLYSVSLAATGPFGHDIEVKTDYIEVVPPIYLGDINGDGLVNSTDALIILSCDVGLFLHIDYCYNMPCGDVNLDGEVNSTDALIIISHDAGMEVPFPVGDFGCPDRVSPCLGCI
ncbi:PKD domain-containing protein [candidate division KSB1 bacterium]|nr:PKD domain-containing protein [candidate division KSB1 bacterium]